MSEDVQHSEIYFFLLQFYVFNCEVLVNREQLWISHPWRCTRSGCIGPWAADLLGGNQLTAVGWDYTIFKVPFNLTTL